MIILCIFSPKIEAQYWQALPPYNILWPLWSPALSSPDPVTGVPTPLVTELTANTVLPVQPAVVWNPNLPYYYLLYNYVDSYGNNLLKFYDYGSLVITPTFVSDFPNWPPSYLLQVINLPIDTYADIPLPIDLPLNFDNPVNKGLTEFCVRCGQCSIKCPAKAISKEKQIIRSIKKYVVDSEKCNSELKRIYPKTCLVCVKACPFSSKRILS